ncbi:unnamed protein product [Chrysoparadoxa australica]
MFEPKCLDDLEAILQKARTQDVQPRIRCLGAGHSYSQVFCDDNSWLVKMKHINKITYTPHIDPYQITVQGGVTSGDLATFMDSPDRREHRGIFLTCDTIFEVPHYAGVIATGCHGAGKAKTIPDHVVAMSIMWADGSIHKYHRSSDPDFPVRVIHMGCLGFVVDLTMQFSDHRMAVEVTDRKAPMRAIYPGPNFKPTPGNNPLKDCWDNNYAYQAFWLPANSCRRKRFIKAQEVWSDFFWNPYEDTMFYKTFKLTDRPIPRNFDGGRVCWNCVVEKSRYTRRFVLPDFFTNQAGRSLIGLGTEHADDPRFIKLYAAAVLRFFEPIGKALGEKVYETSLVKAIHWLDYISDGAAVYDFEVCVKGDDDFANFYEIWNTAIKITRDYVDTHGVLPLNVAMETRLTKHSDSPLSPAYGKEGDVFCWIEVICSVDSVLALDYCTELADGWLALGGKPHWGKFDDSFVRGSQGKMREINKDVLPFLRSLSEEADPTHMFRNDYMDFLFDLP